MSFRFLRLASYPIHDQLLLEEALLRSESGNWCIVNEGSPPAIVMGISGKKEELVHCEKAEQEGLPLIKRFSGGGTVVVDENTLFVTFISQKELHDFPPWPEAIMKWTEEIYREVFQHPDFALRENDYAFSHRKCGGNAQYIRKDRWLHHTSFLWDYAPDRMQCLLQPKKMPTYREGRSHDDFLCKLAEFYPDREVLIGRFIHAMQKRFPLQFTTLEEARGLIAPGTRQATVLL